MPMTISEKIEYDRRMQKMSPEERRAFLAEQSSSPGTASESMGGSPISASKPPPTATADHVSSSLPVTAQTKAGRAPPATARVVGPMPEVNVHGSYGTSRAVLNVIGAFGGLIAIGGGIGSWGLVDAIGGRTSLDIPGFLILPLFFMAVAALFVGVVILALAQMGLATIDSADYNRQMLRLAEWEAKRRLATE